MEAGFWIRPCSNEKSRRPSRHAADSTPGLERQPQAAIEPKAVDRCRGMNGADAREAHASPLERALLQHAARRGIADTRPGLQSLMPKVAKRVIDDGSRGSFHQARPPVARPKPIAELGAVVARIDAAGADQRAVQHDDEASFAVALV